MSSSNCCFLTCILKRFLKRQVRQSGIPISFRLFHMKKGRKSERKTFQTSLMAQMVKRLPTMQKTWVLSLGQEDPLEKEMATHSCTLAWKIPWMEEHGRLYFMGSKTVGHDWATLHHTSHQTFPQFIVIHTVKGFGIVNKAVIDVFLEPSCFFWWSGGCWQFDLWFLCLF